jgi:hypothetical protein
MKTDDAKREKINEFTKTFKGSRTELNRELKRRFDVHLVNPSKYRPHIGLKQQLKALMKTGLTKDQAMDKLAEQEG